MIFGALEEKAFENNVEKGGKTGNQHFLPSPQCFRPYLREIATFGLTFKLSSANAFNMDMAKILLSGKELIL